jgi:hypothetical protein
MPEPNLPPPPFGMDGPFPKRDPLAGVTAEDVGSEIADMLDLPSIPAVPSEDGWPEPMSKAAFHGLAGDFVGLVLPETEADPQALLVTFLVGFGCLVGRKPFYQVESTRHGCNLFSVIVGDTSKSRKGTATDRAMYILSFVDSAFMETRKRSGLSSGEGLIHAVRDAREEDVPVKERSKPQRVERQIVDTGEPDKRLLVNESEFGSVLQQSGRDRK